MSGDWSRRRLLAALGAGAAGIAVPGVAVAHHRPGHQHGPGTAHIRTIVDEVAMRDIQIVIGPLGDGRPDAATCIGAPIVITAGGTYSGCYVSDDPDVAAVTIDTSDPVTISGAGIRSKGPLISAPAGSNPNLTVLDTTGVAVNPGVAGRSPGRFVQAEGGTVQVRHCRMVGTAGMYLLGQSSVILMNNDAVNIDGRHSTGAGYSTTDSDFAQFAQTNQVVGHVEIGWNRVTNTYGQSAVEDNVSIYKTVGSSGDRVDVHHNLIDGAYPLTLGAGYSGSGVLVDDDSAWAWLHDNVIVATTNAGIGIAADHDNLAEGNRIVGSGRDPDGDLFAAANVGLYVWNLYEDPTWANNSAPNNAIAFHNSTGARNDVWFPDCADCTGNTSAVGGAGDTVTAAHEDAEVAAWESARSAAGQIVGPR